MSQGTGLKPFVETANRGMIFVSVFRWVLLLLAAEVIKKVAEGTYDVLAAQRALGNSTWLQYFVHQHFATHPVVSEWIAWLHLSNIDEVSPVYLIGLLQLITTVLLVFRYFICLVDPVWRSAGIELKENFSEATLSTKLASVRPFVLLQASVICLIEFLVIYHSAKAVGDIRHWLHLLGILVVSDLLLFFIPYLDIVLILLCIGIFISLLPVWVVWLIFWEVPRILGRDQSKRRNPLEKLEGFVQVLRTQVSRSLSRLRGIWHAYFIWDMLDLLALLGGAACLYIPIHWHDLIASGVVTMATLLISWLNLRSRRAVYSTHLAVLRLKPRLA